METNIFLSLGSNQGDSQKILPEAIRMIGSQAGTVVKVSSVYRTAAWGKADQPDFLNQVIQVQSSLMPAELMDAMLGIEQSLGRHRTEKWAPRTIDIDLLFYGDNVTTSPSLTLPHPHLQNRNFVLIPLDEIAPDFIHPVLKKTVRTLLAACEDTLPVIRC